MLVVLRVVVPLALVVDVGALDDDVMTRRGTHAIASAWITVAVVLTVSQHDVIRFVKHAIGVVAHDNAVDDAVVPAEQVLVRQHKAIGCGQKRWRIRRTIEDEPPLAACVGFDAMQPRAKGVRVDAVTLGLRINADGVFGRDSSNHPWPVLKRPMKPLWGGMWSRD